MDDRVILATYSASFLSIITNPENNSHLKLLKDSSSNRINDLLRNKTIPITLYGNFSTFSDTKKRT